MRALISNQNIDRLEEATDTKITKNCDQAIGKALDELETLKAEKEENDSFVMNVCNETKAEMEEKNA